MRVLFTGFGPFGDWRWNPAAVVAEAACSALGGISTATILPVTFAAAWRVDVPAASTWVVGVGLAADRARVSVETLGRNMAGGRADNDGEAPRGEIVAGAPATFRSGRAEALATALGRGELGSCDLSDDAGGYVCNALLFGLLYRGVDATFVHVPLMDEPAARACGRALAAAVSEVLASAAADADS